MLIQLEQEFWDKVVSGNPPELDGSEASQKFLNRLYPESVVDTSIELPQTAVSLVEQYSYASQEIKRLTEVKQETENLLKQMLGDNEVGVIGGIGSMGGGTDNKDSGIGANIGAIITWKSSTQERLDTKAIKAEHPTLSQKYLKEITSRRFSIRPA